MISPNLPFRIKTAYFKSEAKSCFAKVNNCYQGDVCLKLLNLHDKKKFLDFIKAANKYLASQRGTDNILDVMTIINFIISADTVAPKELNKILNVDLKLDLATRQVFSIYFEHPDSAGYTHNKSLSTICTEGKAKLKHLELILDSFCKNERLDKDQLNPSIHMGSTSCSSSEDLRIQAEKRNNSISHEIIDAREYYNQGKFHLAARIYSRAGENYIKNMDFKQAHISMYNSAEAYIRAMKYNEAGNHYRLAAEFLERVAPLELEKIAQYYLKSGETYSHGKRYFQAGESYEKAALNFSNKNEKEKACKIYNEAGKSFLLEKEYIKAGDAYYDSALINENLNNKQAAYDLKLAAEIYSLASTEKGINIFLKASLAFLNLEKFSLRIKSIDTLLVACFNLSKLGADAANLEGITVKFMQTAKKISELINPDTADDSIVLGNQYKNLAIAFYKIYNNKWSKNSLLSYSNDCAGNAYKKAAEKLIDKELRNKISSKINLIQLDFVSLALKRRYAYLFTDFVEAKTSLLLNYYTDRSSLNRKRWLTENMKLTELFLQEIGKVTEEKFDRESIYNLASSLINDVCNIFDNINFVELDSASQAYMQASECFANSSTGWSSASEMKFMAMLYRPVKN